MNTPIKSVAFLQILLLAVLALASAGCSTAPRDFEKAKSTGTVEAFEAFLTQHPEGELAELARTRICSLEYEKAAAENTTAGYAAFLERCPEGEHTEAAETILARLRTRIAFVSDRDGNNEVYVMDADGTSLENLTRSPSSDVNPTWSPDRTRIAFVSDRTGDEEIYVMNAEGSQVIQLTKSKGSDQHPAWSPDGQYIAFSSERDGNHEIYTMRADGSEQVNLTNHRDPDLNPAWSPDGASVMFTSWRSATCALAIIDRDGSDLRRLAEEEGSNRMWPAWAPDGQRLAFVAVSLPFKGLVFHGLTAGIVVVSESRRAIERAGEEIHTMGRNGMEVRKLTEGRFDSMPSWSWDGTRLAFTCEREGNREICVMAADGSQLINISRHPAKDLNPDW